MRRKIIFAALAAAAVAMPVSSSLAADSCNTSAPSADSLAGPLPTGDDVRAGQAPSDGPVGGQIGIIGSTGYLKASGNAATASIVIEGHSAPLNGKLTVGAAPGTRSLCLNGTTVSN